MINPVNAVIKFFHFFIIVAIFSCSNTRENKNLPELSGANKIKLTYKTDFDQSGKIVLKSVEVTTASDIEAIKKTVSTQPFSYQYCISTGSITFLKDSVNLIEMVFNTTPDFRHIAYNYNNKVVAVALSEEDAKFLESFKKMVN